jgi:hypothetical protein
MKNPTAEEVGAAIFRGRSREDGCDAACDREHWAGIVTTDGLQPSPWTLSEGLSSISVSPPARMISPRVKRIVSLEHRRGTPRRWSSLAALGALTVRRFESVPPVWGPPARVASGLSRRVLDHGHGQFVERRRRIDTGRL